MPRDKRLYMTFPIDFHRHPKIQRLSDSAFRAFVEANGESRIAESDGRLPTEDAEFMWGIDVMAELVASHPSRPLVLREGDEYVIRDYSEHQFTTADRERLAKVSRENGAKGGRPPKPKETQSGSSGTQTKPESESESGIDGTYVTESQSGNTPPEAGTDTMSRSILKGRGISPDRLITHIKARTGIDVTATSAMKVALNILERAGQVKTNDQRYVLGAITRSPAETQQFIYENGLAE